MNANLGYPEGVVILHGGKLYMKEVCLHSTLPTCCFSKYPIPIMEKLWFTLFPCTSRT